MPNWCANVATFSHSDPAEIKRLESAFARGEMMKEFLPCPEELIEGTAPADGAVADTNVEKYGAADWYSWCLNNWGTKWDVGDADGINDVDEKSITVYFDSAWSPPTDFYEFMHENGWRIDASYYEPGIGFCGNWLNGEDNQYEITGDSEWVVENIPSDLDETFQISANMEMWEQDDDEDETEDETETETNEEE